MKEGELGEAAGGAELLFRPVFPILQAERFSPLGKVELAEEPGDPDIDGKGVPAPVGVQQHAAGNLGTNARELLEVLGGAFRGPGFRDFQKFRLLGEDFGGGGEVFGAVAELALAKAFLAGAGEAGGGGKIPAGAAEGTAQTFVDLANLDDLLQRRADKVGEALPGIFAEGAQARMRLPRLGEPRVAGGGGMKKGIEREIQREVVLQRGAGEERIVPDQLAVPDRQGDGLAADPAGELARGGFIPAEGLAAEESGGQIERNGELQGGHDGEKLTG